MRLFVRVRQMARDLRHIQCLCVEGKGRRIGIAVLPFHLFEVHRAPIYAGRRAGLESSQAKSAAGQGLGKPDGGGLGGPSSGETHQPHVEQPIEKSAGGQDHRLGRKVQAGLRNYAPDPSVLHDDLRDVPLLYAQSGLMLDHTTHLSAIHGPIRLRPGSPYRGSFGAIQHAKLDAGAVAHAPHLASKGVNLPDQMPLGHSTDGRIAGHLTDLLDLHRDQQGRHPHPRNRQRRFASGVAPAHNNHVVRSCIHTAPFGNVKCQNQNAKTTPRSPTMEKADGVCHLSFGIWASSLWEGLFPDAEFRKNMIQDLLRGGLTHNLAQRI